MKNKKSKDDVVKEKVILKLYISGMSVRSMEALQNIKNLCDEYLEDSFELEVIDIYKNPKAAEDQHIVFSPSLIKQSPLPRKILIGNLSDKEKVIKILGISVKS